MCIYVSYVVHVHVCTSGVILRRQLIALLESRVWNYPDPLGCEALYKQNMQKIKSPAIEDVDIPQTAIDGLVNLAPFLNHSSYTVHSEFSLYGAYQLFRALSLRHLICVDDDNKVVGMITRNDLTIPVVDTRFIAKMEELSLLSPQQFDDGTTPPQAAGAAVAAAAAAKPL